MSEKIPVTLVTGFLGAGKTTLLNEFMRDARSSDTAVIVNEFGDVDLDGSLLDRHRAELFVSSAGCMCCVAGSDLRDSLLVLHNAAETARTPIARVIVETTGLADPTPIVGALLAQPSSSRDLIVNGKFELSRIVVLVDAIHGGSTLDRHFEALRQVAFADTVILTKTDLAADAASQADMEALRARIAAVNPGVPIVDRHAVDTPALLECPGSYSLAYRPDDVREWLATEGHGSHGHSHSHAHGHSHAHHDRNRHSDRVRAFCLVREAPVSAAALKRFLTLLATAAGPRLLRVKGLVATRETPDQPTLIHAVQSHVQKPRRLDSWPDHDRRSRLVVIGRDLDERGVGALFEALTGQASEGAGWFARLKRRLAGDGESRTAAAAPHEGGR